MQQSTIACQKSKRATTYHQQPNALPSLDIYMMMSYQHFQALCAISLSRSHWMLMLNMILDRDDHHLPMLCNKNFFFLLDSMFMNIEPGDRISRLVPANLNHTFDLLDNGWCYHHTRFNVCRFESCTIILTFQCPSPFWLEGKRLLLKKPSSSLLPNLLLVAPVQVWLRYLVPLLTPLSQEYSNYSGATQQ